MDLKQIRYLVAVAEAGSFSAAARRAFVTQPTLSAAVAALERELGVRFFERGGPRPDSLQLPLASRSHNAGWDALDLCFSLTLAVGTDARRLATPTPRDLQQRMTETQHLQRGVVPSALRVL